MSVIPETTGDVPGEVHGSRGIAAGTKKRRLTETKTRNTTGAGKNGSVAGTSAGIRPNMVRGLRSDQGMILILKAVKRAEKKNHTGPRLLKKGRYEQLS